MGKCMIGEATILVLAETINQNPLRSPFDIAILANRKLESLRMRANLTSGMVNSFLTYHPRGQELVREGKVAATKNKKLPDWSDKRTVLVDNLEQKPGELVVVSSASGLTEVDEHITYANNIMNRLARRVPASAQRDVSTVVSSMSLLAMTIRLQQEVIDARTDAADQLRLRLPA